MDWKKIKDKMVQGSAEFHASLGVISSELSSTLASTEWFKSLNDYTSELSKSMDGEFLREGISKVMTPSNHRIMDGGHDFFTTIEKARELGEKNDWSNFETFEQWASSYFTDLSSNAGMPMFGKFTDEIYEFLRSVNISEKDARDFLTLNGQEAIEAVIGATIGGLAIFLAWKSEDKERFSKTIAGLLLTSTISMNPVFIMITIIGLAFGYQKLVCKEAIARGAIVSGVTMFTSALIPGPLLIGLIPAIIASVYVNKKMGTEFKPIEYSRQIIDLLMSKKFRTNCENIFDDYKDEFIKKAA